jgi:hypothetical protein
VTLSITSSSLLQISPRSAESVVKVQKSISLEPLIGTISKYKEKASILEALSSYSMKMKTLKESRFAKYAILRLQMKRYFLWDSRSTIFA